MNGQAFVDLAQGYGHRHPSGRECGPSGRNGEGCESICEVVVK